jgi:hypothetical protein
VSCSGSQRGIGPRRAGGFWASVLETMQVKHHSSIVNRYLSKRRGAVRLLIASGILVRIDHARNRFGKLRKFRVPDIAKFPAIVTASLSVQLRPRFHPVERAATKITGEQGGSWNRTSQDNMRGTKGNSPRIKYGVTGTYSSLTGARDNPTVHQGIEENQADAARHVSGKIAPTLSHYLIHSFRRHTDIFSRRS